MRVRALPLAIAVVTMLLVGCTSPTVDEPSATTAPPSAPAPSPTPTDGIRVHSDPATGIVFEDVPDLTGDEADVYDAVAMYQNAFWETLRTNAVSEVFAATTSAEIQDTMARLAADNTADGVSIGGIFRSRISDAVVAGENATATKCNDFRDATFTTAEGTFTAQEALQDVPQRNKLELRRLDDGTWCVTALVADGTC